MTAEDIRERILHVLCVYPILSPSMLQTGLGTSLSPVSWRPVLDCLMREGLVKQSTTVKLTPSGRNYTYTQIRLTRQHASAN